MAHDLMSQFYTSLNLPLQEKLIELTRIIDHSSPNKDLQAIFHQLINNIFCNSFNDGWGLNTVTLDANRYDFEALISFFEPQGPLFRLCYKLLSDPQLKYNLPLNVLPLDLQITLERGRCPQFYADMLTTDSQSLNVVALALNPFDYYIFNFALHLVSHNHNKNSWENWNTVYFALACDYLMHFLPADPNETVSPPIPNYTGKVPMAAILQTANRPLYSPSLLLLPDLTGAGMSNQHSAQNQSRNEVWRSETVLQVFIDIWMSVEQFNNGNVELFRRMYPTNSSSPERVRIVRVLVKHLHSFSAKHMSDPAVRSSALRKYARQVMCVRAYRYVKHLVTTWPLDASFRLVLELWLSLIQPWRYVNITISQDRFPPANNNQEEMAANVLDLSFTQYIAENFPSYTCILQIVLPRFLRLDLTAHKNAVMLFRIGKVFSQPHLVPILSNLEKAICDSGSGVSYSPDTSHNNSGFEQSYTYNEVPLHKWVAIAKQAISEFNLSTNFEYEPVWSENMRHLVTELVQKVLSAKFAAENYIEDINKKLYLRNQGVWASVKSFLMIDIQNEDNILLQELKKVPLYLNASINQFTNIFSLNEQTFICPDPTLEDNSLEDSSSINLSFPYSITSKLRKKPTGVHYMGDPDLMPITSYESTILVRMLYQIASRLNEVYGEQFSAYWHRNDFLGHVAREVLQHPCTIRTYLKDAANHQNILRQNLPARLSLRRLGSHAFVFWVTVGYFVFRLFSFSGMFYVFALFLTWMLFVLMKAALRMIRII